MNKIKNMVYEFAHKAFLELKQRYQIRNNVNYEIIDNDTFLTLNFYLKEKHIYTVYATYQFDIKKKDFRLSVFDYFPEEILFAVLLGDKLKGIGFEYQGEIKECEDRHNYM